MRRSTAVPLPTLRVPVPEVRGKVLVADDEQHIRDVVEYALTEAGYQVTVAVDGAEALDHAGDADLVVLDIVMPRLDGIAVCRHIRRERATPIIFLSSRADEVDRVLGLELGADDYLVKPFSPRELVARVGSVLRRARGQRGIDAERAAPSPERVSHGPLCLDCRSRRAQVGDVDIAFTPTEFAVLFALLAEPERAFSRADLIERAYPGVHHVTARTVDTHVRRIRAKLRAHGLHPVETVHGVGYRASRTRA